MRNQRLIKRVHSCRSAVVSLLVLCLLWGPWAPESVVRAQKGSDSQSLHHPEDVAVRPDGRVIVADTLNHRLSSYPDGSVWGTKGSGLGQFRQPGGIAVDSDGYSYVADSGNHRIVKLDPNGHAVLTWGGRGAGSSQFVTPEGITVSDGLVYVADTGNHRIQVFTTSGTYVREWGYDGASSGALAEPSGIVATHNKLYVTDAHTHQVIIFDRDGSLLGRWGQKGSALGEFDEPRGIAADEDGRLYVTDSGNHRVQMFDGDGHILKVWGGRKGSQAALEWSNPQGVAVDSANDLLYVADTGNDRITVFQMNRKPITIGALSDINLIQGGSSDWISIEDLFADPDGDSLTLSVLSNHAEVVTAELDEAGRSLRLSGASEGTAVVQLRATDPQGASVTASLAVHVLSPSTLQLQGMVLSGGLQLDGFRPDVSTYQVLAPDTMSELQVTPVGADPRVEVTVNGAPVANGVPSGPIVLGDQGVQLDVSTRLPGTTSTNRYTVQVSRVGAPILRTTLSPDTLTGGPVMITVTGDVYGDGNRLTRLKWAEGDRPTSFYRDSGYPIPLIANGGSFSVHTNGEYSVYARDVAGNESVVPLVVSNIRTVAPIIQLSVVNGAITNDEVTVVASVYAQGAGNEITDVHWAPGQGDAASVRTNGTPLPVNRMSFSVTENGYYSVAARDVAGNESVRDIFVDRIVRTAPELTLIASPTGATAGAITVTVQTKVSGPDNGIARMRWVMGEDSSVFPIGGNAIMTVGGTGSFLVEANGRYQVYAEDLAGNSSTASIVVDQIIQSGPGLEVTVYSVNAVDRTAVLRVVTNPRAPDQLVSVMKWGKGELDKAYFAAGGTPLPTGTFEVNENGTYTVYAEDQAGRSTVQQIRVNAIPSRETQQPGRSDGNDDRGGQQSNNKPPRVTVQLPDGTMSDLPEPAYQAERNSFALNVTTLGLADDTEVIVPNLTLQRLVKEHSDASLEISSRSGVYKLPLREIAPYLDPSENGSLSIVMQSLQDEEQQAVKGSLELQGLELAAPPMEFQLIITRRDGTKSELDTFSTYVARAIVVDRPSTLNDHMVVLWRDAATDRWRPVPTWTEQAEDGSLQVWFSRKGNSQYAAVRALRTFDDIQGHWARSEIESMASRQLINGVGQERFDPDRVVTRAEFAALLARALALSGNPRTGIDRPFKDVETNDWFAEPVTLAAQAGLVMGDNGQYHPNASIKREEMAVMIYRAVQYIGYELKEQSLIGYADGDTTSQWARSSMGALLEGGLMKGDHNGLLRPQATATRAEAVVMVARLLKLFPTIAK